jgi:hypothetical protein
MIGVDLSRCGILQKWGGAWESESDLEDAEDEEIEEVGGGRGWG